MISEGDFWRPVEGEACLIRGNSHGCERCWREDGDIIVRVTSRYGLYRVQFPEEGTQVFVESWEDAVDVAERYVYGEI